VVICAAGFHEILSLAVESRCLEVIVIMPSHSRYSPQPQLPFFGLSLALSVTVLAGCSASPPPGEGENPGESENTGQITVLGSIAGDGIAQLEQMFEPFETATGIDVVYEGTDAFATILPLRVTAGGPPDLALFPQPGLMATLARQGDLLPLNDRIDSEAIEAAFSPDWLELGSIDGQLYGLWVRADLKSLVWYRPPVFAEKGYAIPQTWDELLALSQRIVDDGGVPWCIGLESGEASGWVGTDWMEDIMLRTAGVAGYDRWVNHEIPFTDPTVKRTLDLFGQVILNPEFVRGGTVGAISTSFSDAPNPLFDQEPGCYLHRQSSFIASFLPDNIDPDTDVAAFVFPPIDPEQGNPILVGGVAMGMFSDRPEVREFMTYLTTPQPHEIWASFGGYLSPHQGVDLSIYPNALSRAQVEILRNADAIRFDASDMMPSEVGTGSFWSGMVNYVSGVDGETVLEEIEASWPKQ
jgi:alpha-glucoside transport system substrate-binding protein